MDPKGRGCRKKPGRVEGRKPVSGYIIWEKKLFSIKGKKGIKITAKNN